MLITGKGGGTEQALHGVWQKGRWKEIRTAAVGGEDLKVRKRRCVRSVKSERDGGQQRARVEGEEQGPTGMRMRLSSVRMSVSSAVILL